MIAETIEHKGLTIEIIQDEDAPNPREDYDHVGTMVCWHSRYTLGDEQRTDDPYIWMDELAEAARPGITNWLDNGFFERIVTADVYSNVAAEKLKTQTAEHKRLRAEKIRKILDKHYIMLPLGLLDHSGLHMYIGSRPHWTDSGGWDSGQIGWIYCTRKKAIEEWGKKICTKKVIAAAEKYLKGEVEEYDQYLTGDIYGYVVKDEDGEELDSLWGMYGFEYCRTEAIEEADRQLVKLAKEAAESAGDIPMAARA